MRFGSAPPRVRNAVKSVLAGPGVTRTKVIAAVVRLIDIALLRLRGIRSRAKAIVDAADEASEILANTRTAARSSYIHPSIIKAYKEGKLNGSSHEAACAMDLVRLKAR